MHHICRTFSSSFKQIHHNHSAYTPQRIQITTLRTNSHSGMDPHSLESVECGAYLHPSAVQATSPQLHFPTHVSAHFRSWSSFGTNTFRCVRICGTVHSTCAAGEVAVGNDHSTSVSLSGTQCSRPSQICTPSARRRLEKTPAFSVSVRVTMPCPSFTLARKSLLSYVRQRLQARSAGVQG